MLSGKLSIERADNGWVLNWFDRRNGPTGVPAEHREVFQDATECVLRLSDVLGMLSGPAAARALLDVAQAAQHVDPATDADVAALAPPNTPPTVPVGD